MKWLTERMGEPSTRNAVAGFLTSAALIAPAQWQLYLLAAAAVLNGAAAVKQG